jgi:prepilin peptidase CpaA
MGTSLFAFSPTALVGGGVFSALLACACVSDVQSRRIPNWVVASLAATGVAYSVATGSLTHALLLSFAGLLLGLSIWLPLYALHWLGAGDVKLFAAAGAWLGPARTIEGAFIAALAGGVLAVVWMLKAYGVSGTAAVASLAVRSPRLVTNHPVDSKSRRAIPYGVALAIGAMTAAWFPSILTRMFHAAQ